MMRIITFDNINRLSSMYYLNKAINESKLLVEAYPETNSLLLEVEDDSAPYEWDFVKNKFYDRVDNIETDIKKSAAYVRTAEQGIDFIKTLVAKVAELPDKLKSRFVKVAIASMVLTMGYNQLADVDKKVDTLPKNDVVLMVSDLLDNVMAKKEVPKKIETPVEKQTYSDKLIELLKTHEGIGGKPVLTAYNIGDGAYTIGYGHAVFKDISRGDNSSKYDFLVPYKEYVKMKQRGEKVTITAEQAEQLLKDDAKIASEGLDRLLDEWKADGINPKITQPMYDAMTSMIYNMGVRTFRKSEFIQLVKRNKFKEAAEAIKSTSNQMFRKYPGLIVRRGDESQTFKGNYPI
jgi:GH24 family phage-related lysozyme (muramidase)